MKLKKFDWIDWVFASVCAIISGFSIAIGALEGNLPSPYWAVPILIVPIWESPKNMSQTLIEGIVRKIVTMPKPRFYDSHSKWIFSIINIAAIAFVAIQIFYGFEITWVVTIMVTITAMCMNLFFPYWRSRAGRAYSVFNFLTAVYRNKNS